MLALVVALGLLLAGSIGAGVTASAAAAPPVKDCNDGLDNDGDGLID